MRLKLSATQWVLHARLPLLSFSSLILFFFPFLSTWAGLLYLAHRVLRPHAAPQKQQWSEAADAAALTFSEAEARARWREAAGLTAVWGAAQMGWMRMRWNCSIRSSRLQP